MGVGEDLRDGNVSVLWSLRLSWSCGGLLNWVHGYSRHPFVDHHLSVFNSLPCHNKKKIVLNSLPCNTKNKLIDSLFSSCGIGIISDIYCLSAFVYVCVCVHVCFYVCVCLCVSVCVCVVDVVTWSTDSVSVQGLVFPDGLVGGGVQHGPHHLVKALVGVPLQGASLFPVDQTPAKTYRGGAVSYTHLTLPTICSV